MSQGNKKQPPAQPVFTHTGGKAVRDSARAQLRRAVLNCLLWENNFHESGVTIAKRIQALVPHVPSEEVFDLAVEARNEFGLRHVPLLLAREMVRGPRLDHRNLVPKLLPEIIKRPDEIAELLALYWADNDGKKFVTHPLRRGIAAAMQRFNEFQYAKWDRKDRQVRIRDAMFMSHVKPADLPDPRVKWTAAERKAVRSKIVTDHVFTEREALQAKVADDQLKQEGTWEDRLSAGEKADIVFLDLMAKKELGALAFIRNVRKMEEVGIRADIIEGYAPQVNLRGVFPHQLITAARVNKQFEAMFDKMLIRLVSEMPKLPGSTAILIDTSGSMDRALSNRPARFVRRTPSTETVETTRIDAAAAVAIMAREICEKVRIFTFSETVVEVPARRGLALRDAIEKSQPHAGTYLAKAITALNKLGYERLIAITDEQSHDGVAKPIEKSLAYMVNVAPYEHSVVQEGDWTKIEGWSPAVIRYITQIEAEETGRKLDAVLDSASQTE